MNLYLLIERNKLDENEWALFGIFDSEKKAINAEQVYIDDCSYPDEFEDGTTYFEIRVVECNKLNEYGGYLFGFNGLPDENFYLIYKELKNGK